MGVFREDDLIEGLRCCTNRLHDDRMPVTMHNHPPRGDRIQNRMAMFVDEIGTIRSDDPVGHSLQGMLGKGVPHGRWSIRTDHATTFPNDEASKFSRNA